MSIIAPEEPASSAPENAGLSVAGSFNVRLPTRTAWRGRGVVAGARAVELQRARRRAAAGRPLWLLSLGSILELRRILNLQLHSRHS